MHFRPKNKDRPRNSIEGITTGHPFPEPSAISSASGRNQTQPPQAGPTRPKRQRGDLTPHRISDDEGEGDKLADHAVDDVVAAL